ncbi:hypothetical protein T458_07740 [Brevibacillus panacihumi W25]|uniref:Teneurin-like YD-shell domain-containing protein n=2 Tax=Brevibacillus panacihumi TaxID=497735 RepID=V6MJV2_9BACL|nr:hypothetical protein T458_07740 [Brevibacillus panacihumi W25]
MISSKWIKKTLSMLLISSLLLPNIANAETKSTTQVSRAASVQGDDTKNWITAYKDSLEMAKMQPEIGPEDIPTFSKEEVLKWEWDSFQGKEVWNMYNSFDRKALQIVAYFYPSFDRFLSHSEQVEKYEWTDEKVLQAIQNLPGAEYDQLEKFVPSIADFYRKGLERSNTQSKIPLLKQPSSSLTSTLPDAMYDQKGLLYNYARANTDNPVDELYRAANVKEIDLHLDGKHGMDLSIERRYSSLDSMLSKIYYSSSGSNKTTSFSGYEDEYHMPNGWKLNLPRFEEVDKGNVGCSYRDGFSEYACSYRSEGTRYVFTLDDGTVLESSSKTGTWVNTPYDGASMSGYGEGTMENGKKDIVSLYVNGYTYAFQIENNGGDGVEDTHIVTKTNAYGDKIIYRIPEDNRSDIEITDSVGRVVVLDKNARDEVEHIYVYENSSKTKLLKHVQYAWNTAPNTDRILEHDVNGGGSKIIAEYNYHDPGLYGQAEFNLKPNYYFPAAANKEISLDYNEMESTVYTNEDITKRGTVSYKLLKQVTYPVEGLSMTYTYSPYKPQEPDFLKRGVVRLYHDDEKLTYTSYHPVTSVNFRFAKTLHPDAPTAQTYSFTKYYPKGNQEIWKSNKDKSVRLQNQSGRNGAKIVTQTIEAGLPNQEKTFIVNADKNYLLQSVKTYLGGGSEQETIQGRLSFSEKGRNYDYVPISYTSYLYNGRETKPKYKFSFLGRPASMTEDQDVYQFLLEPDSSRMPKVFSRLSKYAQMIEYRYNRYGDTIEEIDPKGNIKRMQYLPVTGTYLRLPSEVEIIASGNPNHFHKEIYTYNNEKLLASETIVDSYPDGTSTKVDQVDRAYAYQNRMLSSMTETSKGADSKKITQTIDWYDDLGLYPAAVSLQVETEPGIQSTLFHYFDYDGLGRLAARAYPDESYVTYQYDMLGRRTSEQFTNQDQTRVVSYAYDDIARKVTVTLPDGSKTFTHFTPFGDVEYKGQVGTDGTIRPLLYNTYSLDGKHLTSSAPYAIQERATTYLYNQDGTVWKKIDPIGTTVYLSANSVRDGNQYVPSQTRLTLHPNGLQNIQYFNRNGQLEKDISRTGEQDQSITTTYDRNAFDQVILKTVMDQTGEQRAWKYRYTTSGNLVYLLDPENNSYQYGYDAYGNLATVAENNRLTIKNHYNAMSWKISEQDVPSGATESYRYFPNGKPATFTDKAGNIHEYAYTPFYDLSSLTTKDATGVIRNKETTEYIPNTSLVKKETNSNGPNLDPTSKTYREVQYTYDPFQRLNSLITFGREYGIGYQDRDDQIDQLGYPDGTVISYHYDPAERLQEVSSDLTGTIRYDYHNDSTGESYSVQYPNGRSMVKKMDSFGQVANLTQSIKEEPVWTESNQYAFGNVTQILRNGTAYQYAYDKVDRLTDEVFPDNSKRYSYDQRGNRAAMDGKVANTNGTTTYTFDERNRLRSITNEGTGNAESYTYFGDGLRATKAAKGSQTNYVYLNGKVIEELDESGNAKARNVWGNELLFRKDYVTKQNGYYGYNSHGDVVSISNEEGNDVNLYEYDAWGNIVTKTEGMANPFKYSGEIYDEASGFYYLRARYYDPSIGRFISEDTYKGQVDNPLSLNRYTYVHNNPVNNIDPTGNWCESADGRWSHAGSCNSSSSSWSPDYEHIDSREKYDGRPYGDRFTKDDLSSYDKYILWMRGDNEVYLNSSRETQLQLRQWNLQEYMADQIARGYPDFLAGLNLDPDALTNYPKLTDHSVTTGRNLPTSSRPNSSMDLMDEDGNLKTRRYFGSDGRALRDVDFTDHGNPKMHPKVPHEHDWDWTKKPPRGRWR